MLRTEVEVRTIFRVVITSAQMSRDLDNIEGDAFEMIISTSNIQARTLVATLLPHAAIDGMDEPLLIKGVLGTGRARAGSNGAEVRGVVMALTRDGEVTSTDADVIWQAGQAGIIIGECPWPAVLGEHLNVRGSWASVR